MTIVTRSHNQKNIHHEKGRNYKVILVVYTSVSQTVVRNPLKFYTLGGNNRLTLN